MQPIYSASWPNLSSVTWLLLALTACFIACLSLGVHDFMLTQLHIPWPDPAAVPAWARYLDVTVRVASLTWFCHLASPLLFRLTSAQAAVLIGLCLVFLVETGRVFLVDLYLTEGWKEERWAFTLLQRLAMALVWFFYGISAAIIAWRSRRNNLGQTIGAVLLVAAVGLFALQPMLHNATIYLAQLFQLREPVELYKLPYPLHVYLVIYATFLEPTIATFGLAALVWPSLAGPSWQRVARFVGLVLLIRGRVVTLLLFSFWLPNPLATAFLSESQFFLETLVLGLLVGIAWAGVVRRQPLAG